MIGTTRYLYVKYDRPVGPEQTVETIRECEKCEDGTLAVSNFITGRFIMYFDSIEEIKNFAMGDMRATEFQEWEE